MLALTMSLIHAQVQKKDSGDRMSKFEEYRLRRQKARDKKFVRQIEELEACMQAQDMSGIPWPNFRSAAQGKMEWERFDRVFEEWWARYGVAGDKGDPQYRRSRNRFFKTMVVGWPKIPGVTLDKPEDIRFLIEVNSKKEGQRRRPELEHRANKYLMDTLNNEGDGMTFQGRAIQILQGIGERGVDVREFRQYQQRKEGEWSVKVAHEKITEAIRPWIQSDACQHKIKERKKRRAHQRKNARRKRKREQQGGERAETDQEGRPGDDEELTYKITISVPEAEVQPESIHQRIYKFEGGEHTGSKRRRSTH